MDEKTLVKHFMYGYFKVIKEECTSKENDEVLMSFLDEYEPNWFLKLEKIMEKIPRVLDN